MTVSAPATWWDCHTHAFGSTAIFPTVTEPAYQPPSVATTDHLAAAEASGFGGVVWVQPSIYGADNSCQLNELRQPGGRSRAIIAPPGSASHKDLRALHEQGVRGLRLNLVSKGGTTLERLRPYRQSIPDLGWHVAAFLDGTQDDVLDAVMREIDAPVVLDHFGYIGRSPAPTVSDFANLYRHLDLGRLWIKISAPYQLSPGGSPWPEAEALALELLRRNPDRILFGSNWPHVGQQAPHAVGYLRKVTEGWLSAVGIEPVRVFGTNPSQLYA